MNCIFLLCSVFTVDLVLLARAQQTMPTPIFEPPYEGTRIQSSGLDNDLIFGATITAGPIVTTASPTSYNNPYTDISAGEILYASIEAQVITAQEYQLRKNRQTSIIDPIGFRALLYSAAGFTGLAFIWALATRFKKFRLLMGSHEDREEDELREDWQKQEQDILNGNRKVHFNEGLPYYYTGGTGITYRKAPHQCTCHLVDHESARSSVHWGQTYPNPHPVFPSHIPFRQHQYQIV